MYKSIIFVLVFGFSTQATAQEFDYNINTVSELDKICSVTGEPFTLEREIARSHCMAFLDGAYSALIYLQLVCLPPNATRGQLIKVLLRWIEKHPEVLHNTKFTAVYGSAIEAFPCGERRNSD